MKKLDADFFHRDCLVVAPDLIGKILVHKLPDGTELRERITETEAYRGEEDKACHASRGRTGRSEMLYRESGIIYVYICYGVHHLMNVVTGEKEHPQGVLFRAGELHSGSGRLSKALQITKALNGQCLVNNPEIWVEDDGFSCTWHTEKRVGIDYAGEIWKNKPWRWVMNPPKS
ncbi:MAG: DNA-3-methyladenine glycosylase [Oscillospiraceae bacterium]|nr:DNA-3-methyladenine glycosylase [Oscillospiraceae bacterium]